MSRNNAFLVIPVELWAQILAFFAFTDRVATRIHRGLLLAGKVSHRVTEHNIVWAGRLSVTAVRLGFAAVNLSQLPPMQMATSLLGYQQQRQQQQQNTQSSSSSSSSQPQFGQRMHSDPVTAVHSLNSTTPSFVASTVASTDADADDSSKKMAAMIRRHSKEEAHRNERNAPIRFALSTSRESAECFSNSFKLRVIFVYFFATMKCCFCGTVKLRRVFQHQPVDGFEFAFPNCDGTDDEKKKPPIRPWCGLRICSRHFGDDLPAVVSAAPGSTGGSKAMRRQRTDEDDGTKSLGDLCEILTDDSVKRPPVVGRAVIVASAAATRRGFCDPFGIAKAAAVL